jgi:Rad3-related DNA helicase
MSIAPALLKAYPALNDAQRDIVGHDQGPLLVIAGPGSGKTFSLVLRALNLLLRGKALPRELVICTYAHILEQRYGKRPDRLLLYWTAEPCKANALMAFPYRPERVMEAGVYFDQVVAKILHKDFTIQTVPENTICKEGDLRRFCHAEGRIQLLEEDGR